MIKSSLATLWGKLQKALLMGLVLQLLILGSMNILG